MEPWPVVVLRDLVEPERQVIPGAHPFGRIDHTGLEGGHDLAARQVHCRGAQPVDDFGPESGNAHLEALKVFDGVDFLLEPAAHLGPGIAGQERLQAEFRVEFVPKLLTAAVVHPGIVLLGHETARHGRVERGRTMLVDPVVGSRVAHLRLAFPNGIKILERRHELARGIQLHGEATFRRSGDVVGKPLRAGSQTREVLRPSGDQPPFAHTATHAGGLSRAVRGTSLRSLLVLLVFALTTRG